MSTAARFGQLQMELHQTVEFENFDEYFDRERLLRRSRDFRTALVALYLVAGALPLPSLLALVSDTASLAVRFAVATGCVAAAEYRRRPIYEDPRPAARRS